MNGTITTPSAISVSNTNTEEQNVVGVFSKHINNAQDNSHKCPKISNKNMKKRKLNQSNNNNNELYIPQTKKRKISTDNVTNVVNLLKKERDKYKKERDEYKRQRDHFKQGMNVYKQEMIKYKTQYLKIRSAINNCNRNNSNSTMQQSNIIDNNQQINTQIETNKENINTPDIITNKNKHKRHTRSTSNSKDILLEIDSEINNKTTIPLKKDATWQNTHYFTVQCHICKTSIDNEQTYITHLKQHYNSSEFDGHWGKCDHKSCNKFFDNDVQFIAHIAVHTQQKMYHCNVTQNDIKCNCAYKQNYYLRQHINEKHYDGQYIIPSKAVQKKREKLARLAKENSSDEPDQSETEECESEESISDNEASEVSESSKSEENDNNYNYNFEDCYFVDVDCEFCAERFNDWTEYKTHLRNEFDDDSTKEWLKCNQGNCNARKFPHAQNFIRHLCGKHGYARAVYCNMKDKYNNDCDYRSSDKNLMKSHLKIRHKMSFKI